MPKTLKIWNGRSPFGNTLHIEHFPNIRYNGTPTVYVAAYSVADAIRVCEEVHRSCHLTRHEIREYWSAGLWGNTMDGIEPERGVWISYRFGEPIRLTESPSHPTP